MNYVEFSYTSPETGETWMLSYQPRQARAAIDAVFRWYRDCDSFFVNDLEEFLREILAHAVDNAMLSSDERDEVAEIVYKVAQCGLGNKLKANLIRQIIKTAIRSPA